MVIVSPARMAAAGVDVALADVQAGGADDRGDAPATGDDRGVAGEAAA